MPLHLRNAPTKLMKKLGYGKDYQYDHDVEGGIALDQTGFPDAMGERVYYQPVARGLEIKLKEKLDALRAARRTGARRKGAAMNLLVAATGAGDGRRGAGRGAALLDR